MPKLLRAVAILLAAALPLLAAEVTDKVVGVSDGDTITVLVAGSVQLKVRLQGIDCPESGQPFGARAKQQTSTLCFGQTVRVVDHGKDRYGRVIGDVYLADGRMLNHELVRAGLAWWYEQYAPKDDALQRLEQEARVAKLGLWADPRPIPPWDWRRGVR